MPVIGAAIAAIGSAIGAGGFLTTFVGRLLISVAASALMQALQPKPGKQREPGIKTEVTQTGGTNPLSFVLMKYATSGARVCPPMSHGSAGKTPNAYLTEVIELSCIAGQALSRVIINDEYVTLGAVADPTYGFPVTGALSGYAWIKYYDGTQTVADPMLLAKYSAYPQRPWSSDMIGRGLCYAICTFLYNRALLPSLPRLRFEMGGIPLYDPRKDTTVGGSGAHRWANKATWEATVNPMVAIYNVKRGIGMEDGSTWGGGFPASDVSLSSYFAAMNECDVLVADGASGTEPQFRAGLEVGVDEQPADIIAELMKVCAGQTAEIGGIWKVRAGAPGIPVMSFTDADIIITSPQDYRPFPGFTNSYNGVHATYPEPASLWEQKEAPPLYNAGYEALDQGQRLIADLGLSACPYGAQVRRLQKAYIAEERRFRRHGQTLPPDFAALEPLDATTWTSATNGYTSKVFEVAEIIDDLMTAHQQVSLRERDSGDFVYGSLAAPEVPSAVSVVPPVLVVASFTAVGVSLLDPGGVARRAAVQLGWDGSGLPGVTGIEYEVRLASSAVLVKRGSINDVASNVLIVADGIIASTVYQARARLIAPALFTDWSAWQSATTPVINGIALVGGTLQSTDYNAGVAGWQVGEGGNAEFNNLVARGWIKSGAVSDQFQAVALGPFAPAATPNGVAVASMDLGAIGPGRVFRYGVEFFARMPAGSANGLVQLQVRYAILGGALTAWTTLVNFNVVATSGAFDLYAYADGFVGNYDDREYRLLVVTRPTIGSADWLKSIYMTFADVTK